MGLAENLVLVFVAGLVTALATGLGAVPFFLVDDFSDRWNVALWGIASGIMVSASLFGLVNEGLAYAAGGFPALMVAGLLAGVALVEAADRVLDAVDFGDAGEAGTDAAHTDGGVGHAHDDGEQGYDDDDHDRGASHGRDDHGHDDRGASHGRDDRGASHGRDDRGASHGRDDRGASHGRDDRGASHGHDEHALEAKAFAEGDLRKLALVLGILTVHSFPEGVAVGVSFAELGLEGGVPAFGFSVPVLAVFMTVAISIHNVPEGTAIAIPMRSMGLSRWRMVGAAVFSSLPQPVGAVIAFAFVRWARDFLPFGFGFAAGAMVYLVVTEFVPEALAAGENLPGGGRRELVAGLAVGFAAMVPLLYL